MKINNIKKKLQRYALSNGFIINKPASTNELKSFIKRFNYKFKSVDLIRIGGQNDGGYLLPNILEEVDICFSPGVDITADFESDLSQNFNIKSFMADASVSGPPFEDKNFSFLQKFIGNRTTENFITLDDWINMTGIKSSDNKILQMDIEGAEYDVLAYEDSNTLAGFSAMVIEFHGFHNIFDKNTLKMVSSIFEKIYKNFYICHVHPNNCSGIASFGGIDAPVVLEISFIRKDYYEKIRSNNTILLPHRLDVKNIKDIPEVVMPEMWWRK